MMCLTCFLILHFIFLFDFLVIIESNSSSSEEENGIDRQFEQVSTPKNTQDNQIFKDWAKFQVFLDFKENYNPIKLPDCHGMILTSNLVLSRAKCITEYGGYRSLHKFNFLRIIKVCTLVDIPKFPTTF